MKKYVVLVLILICMICYMPNVKANIICNDGSVSNTCTDCHKGCCSKHGGCTVGGPTTDDVKKSTSTPTQAPKTETPIAKPAPVEPAKPVEDKKEEVIENKEEKKVEETDTSEEKEEVKEELPKSTSDKKEYDVTPTKEVDYSNYNYQVDSSRETIIGIIGVIGTCLCVGKIIKDKKKR